MSTEIIIKYASDLAGIARALNAEADGLGLNYAVLTLDEKALPRVYSTPGVIYSEPSKTLSANAAENLSEVCAGGLSRGQIPLSGEGTAVAVIDSGIDYAHPDFIDGAGRSRILSIYDQGLKREFTNGEINAALSGGAPLPHTDTVGHGTAVAGVAAGSGDGERGIADKAKLIIVKLNPAGADTLSKTADLMRAARYVIEKSKALGLPVAVNISYGYNAGGHDGRSLAETYLSELSQTWKCVFCVASGNEGTGGHHASGTLGGGETLDIPFVVSASLPSLYLDLWKNFSDDFSASVVPPSGRDKVTVTRFPPTHYNAAEEIYINITPQNGERFVTVGIWTLRLSCKSAVDGRFDVYLPTEEDVSPSTAFLTPDPSGTLTLPSTAYGVITAGGYYSSLKTSAPFSGRGLTRDGRIKPDLTAPAVNITAPRPGGGYGVYSGTSYAAPFVTGASALLLEWGIVKGNDPFLYGEKIKAYLQKGAARQTGITYPNPVWGYGTLCIKDTVELLGK